MQATMCFVICPPSHQSQPNKPRQRNGTACLRKCRRPLLRGIGRRLLEVRRDAVIQNGQVAPHHLLLLQKTVQLGLWERVELAGVSTLAQEVLQPVQPLRKVFPLKHNPFLPSPFPRCFYGLWFHLSLLAPPNRL